MIFVHIIELFSTNSINESPFGKIIMVLGSIPVAPVFMMAMGFFGSVSGSDSRKLIVRGIKTFLLGMFLNAALNAHLFITISSKKLDLNPWHFLFGVDILHLAGISLIILGILKPLIDKHIIVPVILLALTLAATELTKKIMPGNETGIYLASFFIGCSEWSYFPLLPWLAYPLSGYLAGKLITIFEKEVQPSNKVKWMAAISLLVLIGLTYRYLVETATNLPDYYHHGSVFFLYTIVFTIGYYYLANILEVTIGNNPITNYLKWLGKNVTLLYVIQWIIIGNIATGIYKSIESPILLLLCFTGVLITASLLALAFQKIEKSFRQKETGTRAF